MLDLTRHYMEVTGNVYKLKSSLSVLRLVSVSIWANKKDFVSFQENPQAHLNYL